jgi:hypothetical protein
MTRGRLLVAFLVFLASGGLAIRAQAPQRPPAPPSATELANREQLERIRLERAQLETQLSAAIAELHESIANPPPPLPQTVNAGSADIAAVSGPDAPPVRPTPPPTAAPTTPTTLTIPSAPPRRRTAEAAQRNLDEIESRYRQTLTAQMIAETAGMSDAERTARLQRISSEADASFARLRGSGMRRWDSRAAGETAPPLGTATEYLINRLPTATGDTDRRGVYSSIEASLRQARWRQEMADEALARLSPNQTGLKDRLETLLDRIGGNYAEEPNERVWTVSGRPEYRPSDTEREIELRLRQIERDADLEEYVRLATSSIVVDANGQPLSALERSRIAKNALQQLAECLRRNNLDAGFVTRTFRRLFGTDDSRINVGRTYDELVAQSDEYRALNFIRPGTADGDMPQVFRALAAVVRGEQTRIHDWVGEYVPDPQKKLFGHLGAKIEALSLGRRGQVLRGSGDDSLEKIEGRIEAFDREADAAADAFAAAARTPDPRNLPRAQRELLRNFGYIATRSDGTEFYQMPRRLQATTGLTRNLNLPGSTWLDVFSGENAVKAAVAAYTGGAAGTQFGVLLEGLEVGSAGVAAGEFGASVFTGAALDAMQQRYQTGRVDLEEVAFNNLVLGPFTSAVGGFARSGTSALAGEFAKNSALRSLAVKAAAETLGLASEAAIPTYWANLQRSGQVPAGMTYDDFLANLANATLARAVPATGEAIGAAGNRTINAGRAAYRATGARERFAAAWEQLASANPTRLRAERAAAATTINERMQTARETLFEIAGAQTPEQRSLENRETLNRLNDPANVARVNAAMREQRFSWNELQQVHATMKNPNELNSFMESINNQRVTFSGNVEAAKADARVTINREYEGRQQRLLQELNNLRASRSHPEDLPGMQQGLQDAMGANIRWRDRELGLLNAAPTTTGAGSGPGVEIPSTPNRGSDIDRNLFSSYLRDALVRQNNTELLAPRDQAAYERGLLAELEARNTEARRTKGGDELQAQLLDNAAWLRRARQAAIENPELVRGASGVLLPPTPATVYDLNEYQKVDHVFDRAINRPPPLRPGQESDPSVMRDINPTSMAQANVGVDVQVNGLTQRLSQADATEASSMASAMYHLNPQQRLAYENNLRRAAITPESRVTLESQLAYAREGLVRGDRDLRTTLRQMGLNPETATPDAIIRAKDRLYGERAVRLRDREFQLEQLPVGDPRRQTLAAEIQREWNQTMRDGVETYSDLTGIDIVVRRIQAANGPNTPPADRVDVRVAIDGKRANEFTAEALGITRQQAQGMLNDQLMMVSEHVEMLRHQQETPEKAASALSKYAERVVLALKLQGVDINQGDARILNEMARDLAPYRKDFGRLKGVLEGFDNPNGGGNMQRGLDAMIQAFERALPGANGILTSESPANANTRPTPPNTLSIDAVPLTDAQRAPWLAGRPNAQDIINGRILPDLEAVANRARAAGVDEATIQQALQRAAPPPSEMLYQVEQRPGRMERELVIASANQNGLTIVVDEGRDPLRELRTFAGGVAPTRVRQLDPAVLREIGTKVELQAQGRPQTFSPQELRILKETLIPAGDSISKWVEFDTGEGGLVPLFSGSFQEAARRAFQTEQQTEPYTPRPSSQPPLEARPPQNPQSFTDNVARANAMLAMRRERERDAQEQYLSGAPLDEVTNDLRQNVSDTEAELADLQSQQARDRRLSTMYRPEHWTRADAAERERDSYGRQLQLLPACKCGLPYVGPNDSAYDPKSTWTRNTCETDHQKALQGQLARVQRDLNVMTGAFARNPTRGFTDPYAERIATLQYQLVQERQTLDTYVGAQPPGAAPPQTTQRTTPSTIRTTQAPRQPTGTGTANTPTPNAGGGGSTGTGATTGTGSGQTGRGSTAPPDPSQRPTPTESGAKPQGPDPTIR